jgi:hypothetical protein
MPHEAQSTETRHVFVSYRISHKELAVRISKAAEAVGWTADTIQEYLNCPYPVGSPEESMWLTDEFAKRITFGSTFVIMATKDAEESRWMLWEAFECFAKSYRVIVLWLSGSDPLKIVFPLPRIAYRFINSPQSFIVDARNDPDTAVTAVTRILNPSQRYRIVFTLQRVVTTVVCTAMLLLPVTVVVVASMLPQETAAWMRSVFLRPWVCFLSMWLSLALTGIFYPSYGGPSRLDPHPVDKRIRLITPGFTSRRWHKLLYLACFVLACALNGIDLFSLRSARVIGFKIYLEAAVGGWLLRESLEQVRWKLFKVHSGKLYRKITGFYNVPVGPT